MGRIRQRESGETLDLTWVQAVLFAALVAGVGWFVLDRFRDLLPPGELSFAAGRPGGAYHELATRYRTILARDGIEVNILETAGSVENAGLLSRDGGSADVAFLQGGVPLAKDAPVEALAATFLEPLWVVHTGALPGLADPTRWQGLRVAAGEPGSGTRYVADAVSAVTAGGLAGTEFVSIGGKAASDALLAGDLDVALFVAPVNAPYLRALFANPRAAPIAIRDGEALARRLPFVQLADVPRAGFDYAAKRPPHRIELIAMVGRLVARDGLHPALVDRLINAAREIHSGRDLVTAHDQFPSVQGLDMPVNAQAANSLSSEPSALYRFLPYWIVAQINSFALLLLPLLVILLPLSRSLPGIYQWRMRSRVYRRYRELLEVEQRAFSSTGQPVSTELHNRLNEIETEVSNLRLPARYREYAYTMRVHINLVRQQLIERERRQAG